MLSPFLQPNPSHRLNRNHILAPTTTWKNVYKTPQHSANNHTHQLGDLHALVSRLEKNIQTRGEMASDVSKWEERQHILNNITHGLNETRAFLSRQAQRVTILEKRTKTVGKSSHAQPAKLALSSLT